MTTQPQLDLGIATPEPTPRQRLEHPDGGQIPTWVQDEIDDHFDHRPKWGKTKHFRCTQCAEIVIAWSGDFHPAYDVTLDPTPIGPHEELACHLTGRPTVIATIGGNEITILDFRNQWNMTRRLAWNQTILPTHRCGARFPGFHSPPEQPSENHSEPDF